MALVIVLIFIIGYAAISLEHALRIDKLIPALLMMTITWAIISFWSPDQHLMTEQLLHHFGKTTEILIFLMGAMAIVEMIDYFDGFKAVQSLIRVKTAYQLLLVISILTFVLSAIIDNLTATIVLISILRKMVAKRELRMWMSGFVVIAANAGGAWSPIGDVTTTMLWIAGKVSSLGIIENIFLPSVINLAIPLLIASRIKIFKQTISTGQNIHKSRVSNIILLSGLGLIILVPIFKTVTHLPPYMGMMFSLAIFAIIGELLSKRQLNLSSLNEQGGHVGPTLKALSKIEMPSILFFLGILMTVAGMEQLGMIEKLGENVLAAGISKELYISILGIASAVIDNVPLVAASIGMFKDAMDADAWHFIAYTAGTGGSILIIGSAAGVVAMGMENIGFGWYLKRFSLVALAGYIGGVLTFLLL
ncbi:MAG: sodium:proton antiporter [Sphingomonadales bacterium]|nr:sodium:proton antiporter [Sphingomonadales bacterium]